LGLVSRSGIIPIAHSQDTAGPMARSVADAALMLAVMTGADPKDPVTQDGASKVGDYRAALEKGGLKGARIGVARNFFGRNDEFDAVIEKALADLKAQGAMLIDRGAQREQVRRQRDRSAAV
jgi:amidase